MRGAERQQESVGDVWGVKSKFLNIITMSWPDWFAVSIFKSVNWEMSKRRIEIAAVKSEREQSQGEENA